LAGGIRDRIELGFERFGRAVARRPWIAIALSLLLGLGLAAYAPLIEIDTSTEQMLKRSDPTRLRYEAFREQFGRDELIAVGIAGPRVFSRDFLDRLAALHRDLERGVPKLVEITSLVNARDVRGEPDGLVVEDLLEEMPESEAALAALEARVLASPTYRDLLISGDGRFTSIVLETEAYSSFGGIDELAGFEDEAPAPGPRARPFLSGAENREIVEAVEAVVARHQAPGFEISVAGTPLMITRLADLMARDMQRFVALSLLVIGVLLYFLFGSIAGVVLPLLVVVLSLAAMFGLVVLAGEKMTPPLQILPTFQLTVGVAYPIHFLAIFFKQLRSGATREDAVSHSLGHSGLPIAMTALTTMGGMASFATAALQPLAMLGYLVPAGVLLALVFSLVLLPGLVMVIPLRAARFDRTEASGVSPIDRLLLAFGRTSLRHRIPILAATLGLSVFSVVAAFSLHFSHNPIHWLPERDPLRVSTEIVNERMGGTTTLDVVVRTGRENGVHEPAVLQGIDRLRAWAEAYRDQSVRVSRATSLVDILKETHQALNENRPDHYAIPQQRELVAQELLLFENTGADDLERIVDASFSQARVTLKLPWADAFEFDRLVGELEGRLPELIGDSATSDITGLVGVMSRTLTAVVLSMAWSYVTSLAVVTALMVLLIGNLRGGLVSMIPNLAPILFMHALMASLHIPLDGFTLMAGATAMGLAVDDTIHFIHVFRREHEHSGDPDEAIRRTMTTTGRANLFACVVLTSGFSVLMISSMENLANFGMLTGFAFLAALFVELLVTPALLVTAAVGGRGPAAVAPLRET
jgi:predicted RND superfamily exporter protein